VRRRRRLTSKEWELNYKFLAVCEEGSNSLAQKTFLICHFYFHPPLKLIGFFMVHSRVTLTKVVEHEILLPFLCVIKAGRRIPFDYRGELDNDDVIPIPSPLPSQFQSSISDISERKL
jgi:hypothetical protein